MRTTASRWCSAAARSRCEELAGLYATLANGGVRSRCATPRPAPDEAARAAAAPAERRGLVHHAWTCCAHTPRPRHHAARAARSLEDRHLLGLSRCPGPRACSAVRCSVGVGRQLRRHQQPRAGGRRRGRAAVPRAWSTRCAPSGSILASSPRAAGPDLPRRSRSAPRRRAARCAVPGAHHDMVHRRQVADPGQQPASRRVGRRDHRQGGAAGPQPNARQRRWSSNGAATCGACSARPACRARACRPTAAREGARLERARRSSLAVARRAPHALRGEEAPSCWCCAPAAAGTQTVYWFADDALVGKAAPGEGIHGCRTWPILAGRYVLRAAR